mmetsp:Transcript_18552/g.8668  ORF Transcript_18552/g.8668 Transcript_18552/m.8668 type:complete len:99 (+) Transcript_18552:464-760(+)
MSNNYERAFSDQATGWAFFNRNAALRHGSNCQGDSYGKKVEEGGLIEIRVDTKKGTLGFVLDGQDYGVAWTNPRLAEGDIYPAVACSSVSGCVEIINT